MADSALRLLEVDELGLDRMDRRILSCIAEKFSGGPVGIETLARVVGAEQMLQPILEGLEQLGERVEVLGGTLVVVEEVMEPWGMGGLVVTMVRTEVEILEGMEELQVTMVAVGVEELMELLAFPVFISEVGQVQDRLVVVEAGEESY